MAKFHLLILLLSLLLHAVTPFENLSSLRFFFVQDPLKLDIVISFPDHGFHLRFDPWSQVTINMYNPLLELLTAAVWIISIGENEKPLS